MSGGQPWRQRDVVILSAMVAMCFLLKGVMEGSVSPVFFTDLVNFVGADAANFLANQSFLAKIDSGMSANVHATAMATPDMNTPALRVAFFFTTALSKQHQRFFPCWAFASQHMKLVQMSDAVIFSQKNLSQEHLAYFRNMRSVTVRLGEELDYQDGAVRATKDGFGLRGAEEMWFAEHDWVIRLNPDVLIMDGDWLLETMLNSSIDGIFQVRIKAVNSTLVETAPSHHAETHVTKGFANIVRSKRFVYVLGGTPAGDLQCRIRGSRSAAVHVHNFVQYCAKGNYLEHRKEADWYTGKMRLPKCVNFNFAYDDNQTR